MDAVQPISPQGRKKANYGVDAPGFQRGALFGGLAGVVIGLGAANLVSHHVLSQNFQFVTILFWPGIWFFVTGCVMLWGSKIGKLQLRDKIIRSIAWRGDEQVLDVGCGHGMMLIAAAQRLTTGHATGIDIWSQADQADNSPEATMENARLEQVADRVEILNADARKIPFPDNSFDVVLSSFVIHNLHKASDREQILREIARVLRPSGQLAIADILHSGQYEKVLRALGWKGMKRWFPNFLFFIPTRVLRASKP